MEMPTILPWSPGYFDCHPALCTLLYTLFIIYKITTLYQIILYNVSLKSAANLLLQNLYLQPTKFKIKDFCTMN